MAIQGAFAPQTNTVNVAVNNTSTSVALGSSLSQYGPNVRVYNNSSQTVFVQFGSSTVTAAVATSLPMAPNSVEVFTLSGGTYLAVIASAAGGTVYATLGEGV
jgi:hypothetical protein